jgi:dTDP-4-amino-4,6-dideoxygalactose transaminase
MADYAIPLHRPAAAPSEEQYLGEVLASGQLGGDGPFGRRCEALLREELGTGQVLLTSSGTHALDMTAHLLGIEPGDEVILPAFTFTSCANAYVLRGAKPVFVDVRPDTLNIDPELAAAAITERTKAIVPVHYAGVACEMDELARSANEHDVALVEDAAHALFGTYNGTQLGTIGDMAAFSFHATKNFTCGEGGALVVRDEEVAARAEIVREKGTNRLAFLRGQVDKYTWVDIGSSYVLAELLAAALLGQLEDRERVQRERRELWDAYMSALGPWAEGCGIQLPVIPPDTESAYHLFYVLMPSHEERDGAIAHLREAGIQTAFHYVPLHLSPMGRRYGYQDGDLPITTDAAGRLVRLPFYNGLTLPEVERVCSTLEAWCRR